jgi:hypothetical protein
MVCNHKSPGRKRELGPNEGKNFHPFYNKLMNAPRTIDEIKYCESKGMVDLIAVCVNQVDEKVADEAIKTLVRMHSIEKLAVIAMSPHPRLSIKALEELDTMAKKNIGHDFKNEAIKAIDAVSTGAEMIENRIIAERMLVYLGAKKNEDNPDFIDTL